MLLSNWAYILACMLAAGGVAAVIFGIRKDFRLIACGLSAGLAAAASATLMLAGAIPALAALAGLAAGLACANAILDLIEGLVADIASFGIAVTGLGAAVLMVMPGQALSEALLLAAGGGVLAWGLLWGVNAFFRWRRGHSGLGGGDIVLAGAAGIWSGLPLVGISLLIACAVTFLLAFLSGRLRDRIAFAPGLVLGFGIAFAIRFSASRDFQL
ncbi:hypothetical protein L2D00_13155 [Hyphomonadaceae bacterium BL14]|nr:hypothetical protein L2D00_13155 [Hyphomonadaceae bacterium BL14]